jgi:hypothetical protein
MMASRAMAPLTADTMIAGLGPTVRLEHRAKVRRVAIDALSERFG